MKKEYGIQDISNEIEKVYKIEKEILSLFKDNGFSLSDSLLILGHLIYCSAKSADIEPNEAFETIKLVVTKTDDIKKITSVLN